MTTSGSSLDRIEHNIESLTEQVGRLTEGLTDLRVQEQQRHQEAMAEFTEIREIVRQQAEIARQQAESISRLIGLLERQE